MLGNPHSGNRRKNLPLLPGQFATLEIETNSEQAAEFQNATTTVAFRFSANRF
jgi:hypothetical protein